MSQAASDGDPAACCRTLAELVRVNSVNSFYPGGAGERAIASVVRDFFVRRGVEVWEQPVLPDRPNIIARLPGRNPGRRLILEAHLDTVSVHGMTIPPFEPRNDGGKLYGRGACDTKGGLAAMMHAVAEVHAAGITPPCEIWFAGTVDEECSFRGVAKLCEGLAAAAALVAEPTEMRAIVSTKGVLRWRIVTRGRAAHSSKPHLGANSINDMARVVLALEEDNGHLAGREHPLLGRATLNVGVIHGGELVNFVPDRCAIEIDRRLLPGERSEEVLAHYRGLLARLKARHPSLDAVMEPPLIVDEAMETDPQSAPARLAGEILTGMGLDGALRGVPFGCDASKFSRQGIPSLVVGPGSIDQAHSAAEFVELAQVEQALTFYRNYILRFE